MKIGKIFDPRGDIDGRRRPRKRLYRYTYTPLDRYDFQPFDILLVRTKTLHAAGIILFSGVDGKTAWLSHAGQVIEKDGRLVVSEANIPRHEYTPIEDYLEKQERDKCRLTLVRLKEELWPSREVRDRARDVCLAYHLAIDGEQYEVMRGLVPMAAVSLLRKFLPFIKRGAWEYIPREDQEVIFICSAIVDWGWRWGQLEVNKDFFPSTLSLVIPSPQDIYETPATEFIAGWRKVYFEREQRLTIANLPAFCRA
jgi:hypothetical protein